MNGDDHIVAVVDKEFVRTKVCDEKHQEVKTLRFMVWGIIVLQLTTLGAVITALIGLIGKIRL